LTCNPKKKDNSPIIDISNSPYIVATNYSHKQSLVARKMILLNQVCSSFEESKSFEFDGRLDVLVVAEVL